MCLIYTLKLLFLELSVKLFPVCITHFKLCEVYLYDLNTYKIMSLMQVVAIKQLDHNGLQGNREFLVEVLMLSLLHHPNLVNLIGYCADGDQRLLVYEYMPLGSLEDHLYGMNLAGDS